MLNKKTICVSKIIFSNKFKPGCPCQLEYPTKYFSNYEIEKIDKFVELFGIDYGELDLLRDNRNKLIYIVDVAVTPGSYGTWFGSADFDYKVTFREKIKDMYIAKFNEFIHDICNQY